MQRFLIILAVAAVAGFFYVTAATGSGMQSGPTLKQFAALKQQVTVLNKKVKSLNYEIQGNYEGDACIVALASDAFQNTWGQIDHLAVNLTQPAIFGAQTAINDKQACEGLFDPKVPRSGVSPTTIPTVAPFNGMITWIAP
jgi:hypothetical protein